MDLLENNKKTLFKKNCAKTKKLDWRVSLHLYIPLHPWIFKQKSLQTQRSPTLACLKKRLSSILAREFIHNVLFFKAEINQIWFHSFLKSFLTVLREVLNKYVVLQVVENKPEFYLCILEKVAIAICVNSNTKIFSFGPYILIYCGLFRVINLPFY